MAVSPTRYIVYYRVGTVFASGTILAAPSPEDTSRTLQENAAFAQTRSPRGDPASLETTIRDRKGPLEIWSLSRNRSHGATARMQGPRVHFTFAQSRSMPGSLTGESVCPWLGSK